MDKTDLIIFDLDGTILDTLEDLRDSLNHVLTDHGFPMRTLEETRQMVGNGIRRLIQQAVPSGTEDGTIDQLYREFLPWYQDHCAVKTRPYDGIPELLARLKRDGAKLGVLSNKFDAAVRSVIGEHFPGTFDLARGECEGVPRKPDPTGLLNMLRDLGIAPADCAYIGDSQSDIETARAAGTFAIAVTWGYQQPTGADQTITHPSQLADGGA